MKKCSKCGMDKSLEEFYANKRAKDGLDYKCKACSKIACKQYREKNKISLSEKAKQYRQSHREENIKLNSEYYRINRDDINRKRREARARNLGRSFKR